MSEVFCERNEFDYDTLPDSQSIATNTLTIAAITKAFANVERVPRYTPDTRESNVEHSFMLVLVCVEVTKTYLPALDIGRVVMYAAVHDLIELITGDVATFQLSDEDYAKKELSEQTALSSLCRMLPPFLAQLVHEYEQQDTIEKRFVRLVDKLLPLAVNKLGTGTQVMQEDYDIFSIEQLEDAERLMTERLRRMFPEPEFNELHTARENLANWFAADYIPAAYLQDALF